MVNNQTNLRVHLINQTINLIWTGLFFTPVLLLWIQNFDIGLNFFLIGLSLLPLFMNDASLNVLQLSSTTDVYEKLGIRKFQAFTQNGKLAKDLINKEFPHYQVIRNRIDIKSFKNQIKVYEIYHLICFIFFFGSAIYGFVISEYFLAILIFISNLFYNVVPILIQQYNKIRIASIWPGLSKTLVKQSYTESLSGKNHYGKRANIRKKA